ncbi:MULTISPECIES: Cro/Cl family transcriptional regulator [Photorhabdus]|uniref:Cro/Cl family transcriptional regulator n=2 Tax=Photorhabdus TaxID=29487 RepID=A0A329XA20_9GAMM|nr:MULTISPECIES: Cro/Cl family transcriptional regulator [Photorhabdus]MCT8352522.1 Cro/Cl family transcriptional regulator [Photorhabdus kayaii]MDB6366519.1 Cro/Cl family transcriptional regulator [Photorhabdus bodei]MDB6373633.1 Cro/Cl family transcriptional regulator [Photorhabdus bodei]NDL00797.1 Cro/Cl family transcriptional regulator [Photorhabdus bodei]NDL04963.1 Cro/Cl family transcriptional regulator [Photorhabdus bodei]
MINDMHPSLIKDTNIVDDVMLRSCKIIAMKVMPDKVMQVMVTVLMHDGTCEEMLLKWNLLDNRGMAIYKVLMEALCAKKDVKIGTVGKVGPLGCDYINCVEISM